DVGGTNTDAVLLEGDRVVHAVKTPTTGDVTTGITRALDLLLKAVGGQPVHAVMIGTTHFTNAVVQRKGLVPVAAIRIGLPASASLEPFIDWPDALAAIVRGEIFMLEGGHEYDGRPIVPFDTHGMRRAARRIRELALRSLSRRSTAPWCCPRSLNATRSTPSPPGRPTACAAPPFSHGCRTRS